MFIFFSSFIMNLNKTAENVVRWIEGGGGGGERKQVILILKDEERK